MLLIFLSISLLGVVHAQAVSLPSVAVVEFSGDQTVSSDQLKFMTGKFVSELIQTQRFTVLDRGKMDYILREQGFQQSGACNTSECKVQMGQLLGMDYLISGSLVRFGREYGFRLEYVNVGSGQIEQTVELSQKGELEEVYKALCHEGANKLSMAVHHEAIPQGTIDLRVPPDTSSNQISPNTLPVVTAPSLSWKRKIALGMWGGALAGSGSGYYFNGKAESYADDYDVAYVDRSRTRTTAAYKQIENAKTGRSVSYGAAIGSFVLGAALWFFPEGK